MEPKRSWWQQIKRPLLVVGIIVACVLGIALIVGIIGGYLFHWGWTGITTKTLWDWLNLLGVLAIPVVVGFGVAWFTTQQGKVADAENKDNQRETSLQAYIDNMSELLLHEGLRNSTEEDEVRNIAHVRTLTILPRLDAKRKGNILQFLNESNLISKDKCIIHLNGADLQNAFLVGADLRGADLSNADLNGAVLFGADMTGANLSNAYLRNAYLLIADLVDTDLNGADLRGANLGGAILRGANLFMADLSGADLSEAFLTGANLNKAKVTDEQLAKVKSL